eukprot:4880259-Alexandrium_andersonii.AAC.1
MRRRGRGGSWGSPDGSSTRLSAPALRRGTPRAVLPRRRAFQGAVTPAAMLCSRRWRRDAYLAVRPRFRAVRGAPGRGGGRCLALPGL